MHVWVNMLLALIIIVLLLMALLLLLAIQVMNLYGGDPKSCAESDLLGGPEMNSIRSRTEHELLDDLSAVVWPTSATIADQLSSRAGEPSADRHP
jgi:hypothetical protein